MAIDWERSWWLASGRATAAPQTRTILRLQTGASAADDSQQLQLTSRNRLQAVSFSSAVSLMVRTGASSTATRF